MRRICPMTAFCGRRSDFCSEIMRHLQGGKQRDEDAERLRERRAEGSPSRTHVQRAHEEIVQRDIRRAGDGDEVHGTLAVAHAAEDGAEDIIGRDERDAAEADGQIGGRAVDGLGGRGHDGGDGADEQEQNRRQRMRNDGKQRDGIASRLCGLRPVAAPTARAMETVVPMARPTSMTVSMCMTCEPMETQSSRRRPHTGRR